jgi:hypothetical protein
MVTRVYHESGSFCRETSTHGRLLDGRKHPPTIARQWLRRELTGYTLVEAYRRYFRQIGFENETQAILAKW